MKRLLLAVTLLFASVAFAQAPPRVTFTASNVLDSGGSAVLSSGKLCFVTTDAKDKPMGYRVGNGSGQTSASPDQAPCAVVTAGAISPIQIINSAASSPLNACVRVVTKDANGIEIRRSPCVQTGTADALAAWCSASGGVVTCNWDRYPIGTVPIAIVQQGPVGPQGTPGCDVGDGTCETVVSTAPAADQNVVQPDGTSLKLNGSPVLTPANGGLVSAPPATQSTSQPLNVPAAFPYRSMTAHGDSLIGANTDGGHCFGASTRQDCSWAVLGRALGLPESYWNIFGVGGTTFAEQAPYVFAESVQPHAYQIFYHHTGINDCNILGCPSSYSNRANAPAMFRNGMTALGIWYLTPDMQKKAANQVCSTGWTSDSSEGYGLGVVASANGASCSFTVYANSVVNIGYVASVGDGGTFRVDVDGGTGSGGATGNFNSDVATDNVGRPIIPSSSMTYAPQIAQVPVTFAGIHTVTITVTSSPTITFTGNTTAGSTYATGITDKRWVQGQAISGPGISSGTTIYQTIEEGVPAGSMPLSQAATATATGVTFTVSGATVRPTFFSGNSSSLTAGGPTLLLTGMPANGHTPFCIADNYADQPSDAYNESIRTVVANLRSWGYDARFVDERASQNGSTTTFTAITTNGSTVVAVSSTAGLHVGDAIFASPGMPQGAVIASIGRGTITLSLPATGSGTNPSGVSHWFYANNDCIHPSDEGYALLGSLAAQAASGLADNTLRSTVPPSNGSSASPTCNQMPCVVAEYHVSGQSADIPNTAMLNSVGLGTYRFCANLAVTAYSSTDVAFFPGVVYIGKYNAGLQVFTAIPATPLQSIGGHYIGYDSSRIAGSGVPTYVDPATNILYGQALAFSPFANVVTNGYNCVTFTAADSTPAYIAVGHTGTNTGGTYALDATLEQLTKQ